MTAMERAVTDQAVDWLRGGELILPTRAQAAIDLLLTEFERRSAALGDIAALHCAMSDGNCLECTQQWPCVTNTWATGGGAR